jgi:gag-polypeptide of LTR copia-type/Zinc knuckle
VTARRWWLNGGSTRGPDVESILRAVAKDEKEATEWGKKSSRAFAIIALSLSASEQQHIIDYQTAKEAWGVLAKLYEGTGRNRKFMLLQELFQARMTEGSMDLYLRGVREKMSELAAIGTTMETDIKLAIILNGLTDDYRYLVVNLEQQKEVDFDELSARFLDEERKIHGNGGAGLIALKAERFRPGKMQCWSCGLLGHMKHDCPKDKADGEGGKQVAMFANVNTPIVM